MGDFMDSILNLVQLVVDTVFSLIPQPVPTERQLANCRLVAHRGETLGGSILENTFKAFDTACQHGAWGLEFDIRWTKDLVPIVHHDQTTSRVFQLPYTISDLTYSELRDKIPEIPTLEEVLQRYGGKRHLMIEVKEEVYPDPKRQIETLNKLMEKLKPIDDYHFITLAPKMFDFLTFVPPKALLLVAEVNQGPLHSLTLEKGWGGLTGHYLLLTRKIQMEQEARGQKIGTGFIKSKNALFRQINREVEWIFTNDTARLDKIRGIEKNGVADGA
mgnify:CR=1 FL=1